MTKPTPPRVDCGAFTPDAKLPAIPQPLTLDSAPVWMAKSIGVYRHEVLLRGSTADCLNKLRDAKVIR